VRFTAVRVRDAGGAASAHLDPRRPFAVEIEYEVIHPATCQIAFRLNRDDGLTVLTTAEGDRDWVFTASRGPGGYRATVHIPGDFLAPGRYHLLVAANQYRDAAFDLLEAVLNFEVGAVGSLRQIDHRLGVVLPVLGWDTRPIGDS
jgi:lipopolysaccharide transport system ATP-binding protein